VGAGTTNNSPLVEHYLSTGWAVKSAPHVGTYDQLFGISGVSASSIWTVGASGFAGEPSQAISYHYNGTAWTNIAVPSITSSVLYGVYHSATLGIWAAGTYQDADGNSLTLILERQSPNWVQIPSPNVPGQASFLNDIRMVSSTLGWAVGYSVDSLGTSHPLIEQWNGSAWSIVPADPSAPDAMLRGIRSSATTAIAIGGYSDGSGGVGETWNGTSWTADTLPTPTGTLLNGIAGRITGTEWAVGGVPGGTTTVILKWTAATNTWTMVSSPNPGNASDFLSGVTVTSGKGWAVGSYRNGITTKPLILHYC
jgi:hypothetical protein